jgi:hypothetical protein
MTVPHSDRCKAGDLSIDISDCPACANRANLEDVDW